MSSQRSSSVDGTQPAPGAAADAGAHPTAAEIAPIFERLPRGPHRLERREVLRHQRNRLHGAMVEAVARGGYHTTSVRQVIGLAGVSRRSFYEHFANRQACFLATFDLIAARGLQRVKRAYLASEGEPEERLRAGFRELERAAQDDLDSTALVTAEAQHAGRAGAARLRGATMIGERLLAGSFRESPGSAALPAPIVRGIAGGLQVAVSSGVRSRREYARGRPTPPSPAAGVEGDLAEQLLRWTLLFAGPAVEPMAGRMQAGVSARLREVVSAAAPAASARSRMRGDARTELLASALRLAVRGDYLEVTGPQIADGAGEPAEAFCALFADREECYLAALDMVADELLATAADPGLAGPGWACAVRRALGALLSRLAARPLYAHTLARGAFAAGPRAAERNLALARAMALLLTRGAPAPALSTLAVDGVAGAIWHTIACQADAGRTRLLPVVCDHLAYIVLTPYLGAETAAQALAEDPPTAFACG